MGILFFVLYINGYLKVKVNWYVDLKGFVVVD